jgi:hypothetical protein
MRTNDRKHMLDVVLFSVLSAAFTIAVAVVVTGFVHDQRRIQTIDPQSIRMGTI